jgi:hypothetical protein
MASRQAGIGHRKLSILGQWVYEKDHHCVHKKSLYSTFQCVSMNNRQEIHLKEEICTSIRYQITYSNYNFFDWILFINNG